MSEFPPCPSCQEDMTYSDGQMLNCPMCGHAWTEEEQAAAEEAAIIRDANGNPLADGDGGTMVQDVKLSGSNRITRGSKVTKISLLDTPYNGHNIEATVEGHGRLYLKSELIKKA